MTDTAAYADTVFGLFWPLGYQLSPRFADIGDAGFWRIDKIADCGPLNGLARNRISIDLVIQNREHMLRLAESIKLSRIRVGAIIRILQVKGHPTTEKPGYLRIVRAIIANSIRMMKAPTALKIDGLMAKVAFVCSATRPSSCGQV